MTQNSYKSNAARSAESKTSNMLVRCQTTSKSLTEISKTSIYNRLLEAIACLLRIVINQTLNQLKRYIKRRIWLHNIELLKLACFL